ncbi:MAG: hypothetical protein M3380_11580 [Chloroflexota bacterium]|nr:hypothetical protein [Chloroflexota bacterium]
MPRFPHLDELRLPATFVRYVPGRLHADGQRYLPLLIFDVGAEASIGEVDRHHLVAPELVGRSGIVRLVFLLSSVTLQPAGAQRQGLVPEDNLNGRASTSPEAYGCVVAVPTWEEQRGKLEFESLYTEFLLDIGPGIVGVRTAATAENLSETLGKARIETGDWVRVGRSRVDILGFEPDGSSSSP